MRFGVIIGLFIVCWAEVNAQFLDLARLEYTYVPGDQSSIDYRRARFVFNYPFKLKEDVYFLVGLDYSSIRASYNDDISSFDGEPSDEFTLLDLNLTYTFPMKNDWRFAVQLTPGLSSNFETTFEMDDMVPSGIVLFIKDRKDSNGAKKPNRLFLGAAYSGSSGVPFPIPFVRYYRKIHPKWSYNLGAPVSNLQYHASERLRLKLFATLDGFNSNLQRDQVLTTGEGFNRVRFNMILLGTRYELKFSEHIESFLTITRSVNPVVQLRLDRNRVLSLPADNVMHYRIGIRCKI